jgi:hypothetical protein
MAEVLSGVMRRKRLAGQEGREDIYINFDTSDLILCQGRSNLGARVVAL